MRKYSGGSLVEYILPVALTGLVVGMAAYSTGYHTNFFNEIMLKTHKCYLNMETNKLIFTDQNPFEKGIYKNGNDEILVKCKNGNWFMVPISYYNKYKNDLEQYLGQEKFEFGETSGTSGIELTPDLDIKLYSTLFEISAKNMSDPDAQDLLENLKTLGFKVGDIEENMASIQNDFNEKKKEYFNQVNTYNKAIEEYKITLAGAENMTAEELDTVYADVTVSQTEFMAIANDFNDYCNSLYAEIMASNTDLKTNIGPKFDKSIVDVKASVEVDEGTKKIVVPVAKKIQAVKNTVEVTAKNVKANSVNFKQFNDNFEEINEKFKEIKFKYDPNAGDECLKHDPPAWCY